jgi:hypothetical protein
LGQSPGEPSPWLAPADCRLFGVFLNVYALVCTASSFRKATKNKKHLHGAGARILRRGLAG